MATQMLNCTLPVRKPRQLEKLGKVESEHQPTPSPAAEFEVKINSAKSQVAFGANPDTGTWHFLRVEAAAAVHALRSMKPQKLQGVQHICTVQAVRHGTKD